MSHGGKDPSSECSICLKKYLKSRTTRQASKDNWIQCDCCKQWFHSICGGHTPSQYSKISKGSLWLKCIICCTQQILTSQSSEELALLTTTIVECAKSRICQRSNNKESNKNNGKDSTQTPCQSTPKQVSLALATRQQVVQQFARKHTLKSHMTVPCHKATTFLLVTISQTQTLLHCCLTRLNIAQWKRLQLVILLLAYRTVYIE